MSGFVVLAVVHGEFPDDPRRWEATVPFTANADVIDALERAQKRMLGLIACSAFQYTPGPDTTALHDLQRRDVILEWIGENAPHILKLCPYKASDITGVGLTSGDESTTAEDERRYSAEVQERVALILSEVLPSPHSTHEPGSCTECDAIRYIQWCMEESAP